MVPKAELALSTAPPRNPAPVAVMVPLIAAVCATVNATIPPVVPFHAGGLIAPAAVTVRFLNCGTRTICAPLAPA